MIFLRFKKLEIKNQKSFRTKIKTNTQGIKYLVKSIKNMTRYLSKNKKIYF